MDKTSIFEGLEQQRKLLIDPISGDMVKRQARIDCDALLDQLLDLQAIELFERVEAMTK